MKKSLFLLLGLFLTVIMVNNSVFAQTPGIPYEFENGKPANANHVNANFQYLLNNIITLQQAVGSLQQELDKLRVPSSCKKALEGGFKNQSGSIGDGIYTIDIDGQGGFDSFQVYCDMTTDGGGWTLVYHVASNSTGSSSMTTYKSQNSSCLLSSHPECASAAWHNKSLMGTQYMKKIQGVSPLLVVKFHMEMPWFDMRRVLVTDPTFDETYYVSTPSATYNGYSGDAASADGCQDLVYSPASYEWAHSDGQSGCSGTASYMYVESNYPLGFCHSGCNKTAEIYIR